MCFIFREIYGKESDKYSRIQVFGNFHIIQLKWVGISRKRINNMGQNEMRKMIIIFLTFCLIFLDLSLRKKRKSLPINNLIRYTLWTKMKHVFSLSTWSLQNSKSLEKSLSWQNSYLHKFWEPILPIIEHIWKLLFWK